MQKHSPVCSILTNLSLPFSNVCTDLPPGYPYQSITAPFASAFPPYHIPPAGMNMNLLAPHPSSRSPPLGPPPPLLPPLHRSHLEEDVKPRKAEPSEIPSVLKQEPDVDHAPRPLPPLRLSCNPELPGEDQLPLLSHRVLSPPPPPPLQQQQEVERVEVEEVEKEERLVIKVEVSSYPVPLLHAEAKPELARDAEGYPACTSAAPLSPSLESTAVCPPQEQACNLKTRPDTPIDRLLTPSPLEVIEESPERPPRPSSCTSSSSEDPMAGLLALAAASEMAGVRAATPPIPTLLPQVEDPDCCTTGALEKVALEGMALLSQMAQQELENMRQERGE